MKRLVILRRCSQIVFFSLFVYILWSTTYPLKGMLSPEVIFKIDPLVMIFTALSERVLLPGLIFSAGMLVLTLVLGRFFCGWVCPLGTVIDGCGGIKKRNPALSDEQNLKLRKIKFAVLGFIALLGFFGIQAAWVFDPLVIVARVISLNVIPAITLAVDKFFIFLIQTFELYGPVYDFYQKLKASILGLNVHFFSNSLGTFLIFVIIAAASLRLLRFWCRALCPLGAIYTLVARKAMLKRRVLNCTQCGLCRETCRMGAIYHDASYHAGECILCMDCVYTCPQRLTRFSFNPAREGKAVGRNPKGISRRQFLALIVPALISLGFKRNDAASRGRPVIRPPGALPEKQFMNSCIRCGNCMKVCITNGLQPISLEAGLEGIWTPQLVPEIGYCDNNCTLCGNVCPTGAIPALPVEKKKFTKLGLALIDRSVCIAWAQNENCIVCEEHCPVADKAIKLDEVTIDGKKILRPYVDPGLCVGCGICQNKCPVSPRRAIRVKPL